MLFLRPWAWIFIAAAFVMIFVGCASTPQITCADEAPGVWPDFLKPGPGKVQVLFFRQANYSGGGRIHLLKIDDRQIGELTADNYYRIELWPGQYYFSVFLPQEEFFGQISPAMNVGEPVAFRDSDAGRLFVYQYTDGMGTDGFKRQRVRSAALLSHRVLGGDLSVRDTAQVTRLFGAAYQGPAWQGRPHGPGTLKFSDGSTYRGLFEYGLPTNKARFAFQDGTLFMGQFYRGRPKGQGVLITPDGHILFAGRFLDEKPHGIGLRSGKEAPEFCVFDRGRDITKPNIQQAREMLDKEDQARVDALSSPDYTPGASSQPGDATEARATAAKPAKLGTAADEWPTAATAPTTGPALEDAGAQRKLIAALQRTRRERELVRVMELKNDQRVAMAAERSWCAEELALGRNLCICAPFASNLEKWPECVATLDRRHPRPAKSYSCKSKTSNILK